MEKLRELSRQFLALHRWQLLGLLAVELIANSLTLLLALIAAQACALIFGYQSVRGRWLEELGLPASTEGILYMLGVVIVFRSLLEFVRRWRRGILTEELLFSLRTALFGHHLDLKGEQYKEKGSGRFLLRFSGDLSSVQRLLDRGILAFSGDIILIFFSLIMIAILNPVIALLIFGWLLLFSGLIFWLNHLIGKVEEERRNRKSGLLFYVTRTFRQIFTVKAFNQRTPTLNSFSKKAAKLQLLGKNYYKWAAGLHASAPFGVYSTIWIVLIFAYQFSDVDGEQATHLFPIVLILLSWRSVLSRLFRIGLVWKKGGISWRKLGLLFDRPTEPWVDAGLGKQVPSGSLNINGVALEVDGTEYLPPVNFRVEEGTSAQLILEKENQRMYLVELLAGIYYPSKGTISIGDVVSTDINLRIWRRKLSFISPTFPIRGKTVLEAIVYSRRRKNRLKAQKEWTRWQSQFPELRELSLQTRIDGEGQILSQKQKKLLQWIRLILSDKSIWVLDIPFSGLSPSITQKIMDLVQLKTKRKTIIFLSDIEKNDLPDTFQNTGHQKEKKNFHLTGNNA